MGRDAAQLGPDGVRRAQHQPTRKRRRAQGEEPSEAIPNSPRLGKNRQYFQVPLAVIAAMVNVYLLPVVIKRRRSAECEAQTQPSRTSLRLRESHDLNQQPAGKLARSSLRTAEKRHHNKQERPRSDCKSPTAQVVHDNQQSSDRKRKRVEIEEEQQTINTPSPLPPWKRAKRPFQSQREAIIAFWDSLSKVWLTKRALEEFNRRTAQPAYLVCPTPIGWRDWRRISYSDQIKYFARHGGPDICDLRGYPEPTGVDSSAHTMNSSQSTLTKSTNSISTPKTGARKSSAYNRDFEQHLIDHSFYPNNRAQRPNNWGEINDRLAQPRPSLSPSHFSNGAFETFQQTNEEALSEDKVMRTAFPIISGNTNIPNEGGLVFTNLEPLTDGSLVDLKPDFYDGARPEQIDQRVRKELGSYIIPSTHQHAPCLPNFFAEGKGPEGSAAVAKRQACYDGALGARGIHMLQSFTTDAGTTYDNNAYTITSSYHSGTGTLQMYTTHPTQPKAPGGEPEYHMTQLRSFAMTDTPETFRQGAGAFRNARDWAREQRGKLIAAANSRVANMSTETSMLKSSNSPSTTEPTLIESDTSADELSQDVSTYTDSPYKRLKREPENRHSKPDLRRRPKKGSSRAGRRSGRGDICSKFG